MLSDYEASEIERRRREGEHGPIAATWVDKLLQDRRERVQQATYFRQRVRQAFEYLDKLLQGAEEPASKGRTCPKCRREYEVARPHSSARGKLYVHPDKTQCVVLES